MSKKKLLILLILIASSTVAGWATVRGSEYRDQALRADSIAASADSARIVAEGLLGDTVVYQRRIVQVELERDSLDVALRQRPVVRVPVEIRLTDTLRVVDTVQLPAPDAEVEDLYWDWEGRDGPFSIRGHVAIVGAPTRHSVVEANVVLVDPVHVGVRVTCQAQPTGISAASVALTSAPPFSLVPGEVQQDPSVCNPIGLRPAFGLRQKGVWAGVGVGVGVIAAILLGGDSPTYQDSY